MGKDKLEVALLSAGKPHLNSFSSQQAGIQMRLFCFPAVINTRSLTKKMILF
jgi:hypothetical protein